MKKTIKFKDFDISGNLTLEPCEDGCLATFPPEGGRMTLMVKEGELGGVNWEGATDLVLEATGLEDFDLSFVWHFAGGTTLDAPSTIVNTGALPGIRTTIPFSLSDLDSNKMFIPRTPGRLKQIVLGHGVKPEHVIAITLTMKKCHKEQKAIFHDLYLSWGEPEYEINHPPILDKLGQLNTRDWNGKTPSEEMLITNLTSELEKYEKERSYKGWSQYGGDLSTKWKGTGFFRTHFDGERWYLVDPEGYRFISTGLDSCIPGEMGYVSGIESLHEELPDKTLYADALETGGKHKRFQGDFVSFAISNMIRAFGEDWEDQWTKLTKNRLVDWHFNTIGNWSDLNFIQKAKLPYVWPLEDFPTTEKSIFRDFPDVFSEEYQNNAKKFAQQLSVFKDDPYLIGYFLRNEPEWAFVQNLLIAEKLLENKENTVSKQVFIHDLKEKYGNISMLNDAWKKKYDSFDELFEPQYGIASYSEEAKEDAKEFSKNMIRRYVSVPSLACKSVDPNHLNLGMRYAMLLDSILLEGHEYFDVFSINGYSEDSYKEVQQAGELTGKPVIVGEFHFGALDVGMPAAGICSVMTQKDRGLSYRLYFERALNSPYFVGAHYFVLNDQATLGRFDGENMQIGLVDVCNSPYYDFVNEVRRVNEEIYDITDGKRTVPEPIINRIPRLMGF